MSISSTLVQRAEIRFHEAADALRAFVGCFWVVTALRSATIRVVPDGTTAISVQLQTSQPPEWFLRGPLVRSDERRFASPGMLIGVRLRPGVAFLLSGIPAHLLVGRSVRLNQTAAFDALVSQDCKPYTPERCIDLLEQYLLQRLEQASLHSAVAAALREIEREHGCVPVADVAAHCCVSSRHRSRLMRVWVGYGPKCYANIVRFQRTLHGMVDLHGHTAAAALASDNGYFDQAHLTLDVARFAGATPGRLATAAVADFSKTRCDDLL